MTPSGTATTMARMMVDSAIEIDGSMRWLIIVMHRHVGDQGHAEIALQQLADPGEELGVERLVQPERGADALELFGRRIVAGQDRGGIARRQPQQQKHEQRHHAHDGNGGQNAAKQISEHRCPSIMRQPLFGCRGFRVLVRMYQLSKFGAIIGHSVLCETSPSTRWHSCRHARA